MKTEVIKLQRPETEDFLKFHGLNGCESRCLVRIWNRNGKVIIVATELPENQGTSVTNAWGRPVDLAKQIVGYFAAAMPEATKAEDIVWIEHYIPREGPLNIDEAYDLVHMKQSPSLLGFLGDGFVLDESRHPWSRLTETELGDLGILQS
jgi:hypothetical protein